MSSNPERPPGSDPGHAFGQAPPSPGAPPMVVLPGRKLFAERAERLQRLAERVPAMADYLRFMAQVVAAQHRVLQQPRASVTASAEVAIAHGVPPLAIDGLWRDMSWREDLDALIAELDGEVPTAQREWFEALRGASAAAREALVPRLLGGESLDPEQTALAPLVGAALQVAWTRQARTLARPPGRPDEAMRALCPCCGALAVASVIQIGMARSRVRYLHCGLCATEWYAERARCVECGDSRTLDYCGLEDDAGQRVLPVQAETCDHCASYLKVVQKEWEADADPLADDLASLALDMLIADRELARRAFNPLLVLGAPDAG
ncbi:formate dehydrogenase accessory protein FdhE [Salinicola sp. JS01]|uniref:formate dehydrogenase accessory protein FdhE n=1 Tax=Salinicola sp. JS01 TaxID=3050071 RepID=UPI00255C007A|nr:formate dehydrogenase accessory protein FdhE [Salinicola sp. JS01]WIX33485.1 formate dehydrogenase accessory protein FdhE [Salinicola sp. JS01]